MCQHDASDWPKERELIGGSKSAGIKGGEVGCDAMDESTDSGMRTPPDQIVDRSVIQLERRRRNRLVLAGLNPDKEPYFPSDLPALAGHISQSQVQATMKRALDEPGNTFGEFDLAPRAPRPRLMGDGSLDWSRTSRTSQDEASLPLPFKRHVPILESFR